MISHPPFSRSKQPYGVPAADFVMESDAGIVVTACTAFSSLSCRTRANFLPSQFFVALVPNHCVLFHQSLRLNKRTASNKTPQRCGFLLRDLVIQKFQPCHFFRAHLPHTPTLMIGILEFFHRPQQHHPDWVGVNAKLPGDFTIPVTRVPEP